MGSRGHWNVAVVEREGVEALHLSLALAKVITVVGLKDFLGLSHQ